MGSDSEMDKSVKEKKRTLVSLSPIAKPLAGKKLCKRTLKLVRIAAENKCLKRGVKEVVKSIRRGNKGFCVIAGNISPIDVITHVPILCEEAEIPYIYVPSKEDLLRFGEVTIEVKRQISNFVKHPFYAIVKKIQDLANAGSTKRPTCCVLVLTKPTKGELGQEEQKKLKADYDEVTSDVQEELRKSLF